MIRKLFILSLIVIPVLAAKSKSTGQDGPSVLVVTAHPDDEAMFAATMYRITHDLGGAVDLALVTDGAGGYRFSTLAEDIYNLDLTDPEIAKNHLPAIRKRELMAGGSIVGIRNYFFMDQPDQGRTEDQDSIMSYVWDSEFVADRLDQILAKGSYDFVFTHLPIRPFHSHHKAASILAIQAVGRMAVEDRPVIMGSFTSGMMDDIVSAYTELEGRPETRIRKDVGPFVFDRSTPLGLDDRLNYNIVVNWLISEHKSQGTMQLFLGDSGIEQFWVYEINASNAAEKAAALMEKVQSGG